MVIVLKIYRINIYFRILFSFVSSLTYLYLEVLKLSNAKIVE